MFAKLINRSVYALAKRSMRSMTTATGLPATDLVLAEEINDKGVLTLNRPKALNALNYEMVEKIEAALHKWQYTQSLVIVKGAGGKAFCAGGDVRVLVEAGSPDVGKRFFKTEYSANYLIETLKIPYVALIDGITMGGGVGLSVHGRYRVATERTLFAMPETAIGFYPDVGASYFLPQLQGKLGWYLGLTGHRLKGKDVLKAGIATHYCESSKIPDLEQALIDLENADDLERVLNDFCPTVDAEFSLAKHLDQINKCFDASTVEEILKNLENDNSEWANNTIKILRTVSPTSLKITLQLINLGASSSLEQCLKTENRLSAHSVEDSDFSEGVRALLISKDNNPKWNPARIEDVTDERVQSFFRPLAYYDELFLGENIPKSKL